MEIDELAETIMDCVMNSHVISEEGRKYVEDHLPMKPLGNPSLCLELYEKTGKERIQKVALIFKTHEEARKWYAQFKQHAMTHQKVHKKAVILDNVLFKYGDYGKSLFQYAEYICEFIDQQPLSVLQHTIPDQDFRLAETHPFYYKINWGFKGFMASQNSLVTKTEKPQIHDMKEEQPVRGIDLYMQKLLDQDSDIQE